PPGHPAPGLARGGPRGGVAAPAPAGLHPPAREAPRRRRDELMAAPRPAFRIAWTADFTNPDGGPRFADVGLDALAGQPHVEHVHFREHRPVIAPEQLAGAHGVIVLTPAVTSDSLANCPELLAVTRFGVGYDSVDVAACTRADVLAIITAGAVDRSMA